MARTGHSSSLLSLLCIVLSEAGLQPPVQPENLGRRALLAGAAVSPLAIGRAASATSKPCDPRTKYSFFGLAAPPIQATWSYDTLIAHAKALNIATIQTAVSRDCVVATTHEGLRFASLVADEDLGTFYLDAAQADGSLPFEVLPLDQNRAAVRNVAMQVLNLLGVLWVADQADLLPWDTTPYGSLAEREAAQREGKKPKKLLALMREALAAKAAKKGRAQPARDEQSLRRVLGLERWDAAEELQRKTRRRLESVKHVHKGLLEHEVQKIPGALRKLRAVAWATPRSVGAEHLPSLEQLFSGAWCVTTEAGVSQFIRAHPCPAGVAKSGSDVVGRLAATVEASASHARFDAELGLCRLDKAFSAFYGHRVYICKRLAAA